MRSSWARQKSLWRGGERRRASAPVNPIPDAANLRGYMEGDNLDGSNNSTLVNGVAVPSVVNLGTLGGTFDQATVANQPLFSTTAGPGGTKPALVFDGTDWLVSSLLASSWTFLHDGTGATIYVAAKTTLVNPLNFQCLVATADASSSGRGVSFGFDDRSGFRDGAVTAISNGMTLQRVMRATGGLAVSGLWHMITTANDTASGLIAIDGTVNVTAGPMVVSGLSPLSTLVVGAASSSAFAFTGPFRRTAIFAGVHDATTQAAVLAWMQGLDAVTYPAP